MIAVPTPLSGCAHEHVNIGEIPVSLMTSSGEMFSALHPSDKSLRGGGEGSELKENPKIGKNFSRIYLFFMILRTTIIEILITASFKKTLQRFSGFIYCS